jgi:DNA (cytosine-5)-methyltransferase 1
MNHIELFAGCGGLSLGLESAGFNLLMANELSPMAAETFARNHLKADLDQQTNIDKVLWISSKHNRENIKKRLSENPLFECGSSKNHYSDLTNKKFSSEQLNRSLLVGSIADLNELLEKDERLLSLLKDRFGQNGVDLVSGGPPCQSFSMVGLRDHSNHRNTLPWEFAKFVGMVKPKMALLENVSGILRAFEIKGKKYYAWHEVAKAFAKVGYVPLCLHINAKYVGVAQNRPRFILLAFRKDLYDALKTTATDKVLLDALEPSERLLDSVAQGKDSEEPGSFKCFDIEKEKALFKGPLAKLYGYRTKEKMVSVKDAIDDLRSGGDAESSYVRSINEVLSNLHSFKRNKSLNHSHRKNGTKVQARFRLNQVINELDSTNASKLKKFIKYAEGALLDDSLIKEIAKPKHWLLNIDGSMLTKGTNEEIKDLLELLRTHKHSQRALQAHLPSPAVLGSPDDTSHYFKSKDMQRTLTVRELARIQSFPDWYEFKSIATTGGQRRKFQVPQYTQVGNAVPPLLGKALGDVCAYFIRLCS